MEAPDLGSRLNSCPWYWRSYSQSVIWLVSYLVCWLEFYHKPFLLRINIGQNFNWSVIQTYLEHLGKYSLSYPYETLRKEIFKDVEIFLRDKDIGKFCEIYQAYTVDLFLFRYVVSKLLEIAVFSYNLFKLFLKLRLGKKWQHINWRIYVAAYPLTYLANELTRPI